MQEKIKDLLNLINKKHNTTYFIYDGFIKNGNEKVLILDREGYKYISSYNQLFKNYKRNSILSKIIKFNPYSIENIINMAKIKGLDISIKNKKYINETENLEVYDNKDKVTYNICWNILRDKIDKSRLHNIVNKISLEDAKQIFIKHGYIPLFDKYNNANEKLLALDKDGFKIQISIAHIKDRTPQRFYQENPYTLENIKLWISRNASNYELLSTEFVSAIDKLKLYCKRHNEIFYMSWNKLSQGERCNKCFREDNSGEKHWNYNPNMTDEERILKRAFLGKESYKLWRTHIFQRDKYTCQCCGKKTGDINAHHLDGWSWCSEGRFDANNGITLCKDCHTEFHILYGKKNNTYEQFLEYCMDVQSISQSL